MHRRARCATALLGCVEHVPLGRRLRLQLRLHSNDSQTLHLHPAALPPTSCSAPQTAAAEAAGGAAAGVKSLSELPAYPGDFVRRRLITFVGIVLGYSCFYLTRNSLTYTAPVMVGWGRRYRSLLQVARPQPVCCVSAPCKRTARPAARVAVPALDCRCLVCVGSAHLDSWLPRGLA